MAARRTSLSTNRWSTTQLKATKASQSNAAGVDVRMATLSPDSLTKYADALQPVSVAVDERTMLLYRRHRRDPAHSSRLHGNQSLQTKQRISSLLKSKRFSNEFLSIGWSMCFPSPPLPDSLWVIFVFGSDEVICRPSRNGMWYHCRYYDFMPRSFPE